MLPDLSIPAALYKLQFPQPKGHLPAFMHLPLQHHPGRLFLTVFHRSKSFIASDALSEILLESFGQN